MTPEMVSLERARCIFHASREAAARCPSCRNFFCRECVGEYQGRLTCAACLADTRTRQEQKRPSAAPALLRATAGMLLLWMVFFGIGKLLIAIPSSFHDGVIWKELWDGVEP